LPPRRAARYVQTIAEAVHHAHEHGILHRDLKPSNVLIDAADQPHITDFGLAKRLESGTDLTVSGQVLGSPQYMPPEQAAGRQRQVGRRSDVYALGAVLYHLLTGRPPFVGETLSDILPQVVNDEPLRPRQLNPAVPADLETVCLKCLEKEMARRYPSALALAEELGRFLRGEPIVARPVSVAGTVWRWCRRKPQVASLAAVALLVFLLGLAGVLGMWRRAESQR
jgi:serine/threonine-protein kinase